MMRKTIPYIMFVCLFAAPCFSSYTYEVYTYGDGRTLFNQESMLIDQQGGMPSLGLQGQSSATILGTSALEEGYGGIWEIQAGYDSSLTMSGGQVRYISLGINATAFFSGGVIQQLRSWQNAWINAGDPPVPTIWNPHITIECLDHFYNTSSKILTVQWLNGSSIDIQLIDVAGYSPTIENIRFIPEPTTLLLFGLGGLLLRKRRM